MAIIRRRERPGAAHVRTYIELTEARREAKKWKGKYERVVASVRISDLLTEKPHLVDLVLRWEAYMRDLYKAIKRKERREELAKLGAVRCVRFGVPKWRDFTMPDNMDLDEVPENEGCMKEDDWPHAMDGLREAA